jgi:hypothetical protein
LLRHINIYVQSDAKVKLTIRVRYQLWVSVAVALLVIGMAVDRFATGYRARAECLAIAFGLAGHVVSSSGLRKNVVIRDVGDVWKEAVSVTVGNKEQEKRKREKEGRDGAHGPLPTANQQTRSTPNCSTR